MNKNCINVSNWKTFTNVWISEYLVYIVEYAPKVTMHHLQCNPNLVHVLHVRVLTVYIKYVSINILSMLVLTK